MSIVIDKNVKEEDRELCIECNCAVQLTWRGCVKEACWECHAYCNPVTGRNSTCEEARNNQTCVNFIRKKGENHE